MMTDWSWGGGREGGGGESESLRLNFTADKWMELDWWDFKVKSMRRGRVDGVVEDGERQDGGEGVISEL